MLVSSTGGIMPDPIDQRLTTCQNSAKPRFANYGNSSSTATSPSTYEDIS